MRAPESIKIFTNQTAVTGDAFAIYGGLYVLSVNATGVGTVDLEYLGPDGATWADALTAIAVTAARSPATYLPPGQYRGVTAGFTAVYADLTRVPFE